MGCDGGTIPKRCELVPERKKKERKDRNMSRIARWQTCALSNQKLSFPIVGCRKGRLYNKEAVIEHILNTKTSGEIVQEFAHVRKLKDVKELHLKVNSGYGTAHGTKLPTAIELQTVAQFVCPLTNLDMNGKYEFVFLFSCGCVMSKRGFKEIKTKNCVLCGLEYAAEDVININPRENDEDGEEKAAEIQNDNKNIKNNDKNNNELINKPKTIKIKEMPEISHKKDSKEYKKTGKSKKNSNDKIDSKFDDKNNKKSDKNDDKSKKKKEITYKDLEFHKKVCLKPEDLIIEIPPPTEALEEPAQNPRETKAYKSLFTSGDTFKNKPKDKKAYWVSTFSYSV